MRRIIWIGRTLSREMETFRLNDEMTEYMKVWSIWLWLGLVLGLALADPVGGCGGCNPPINFQKILVIDVALVIDLTSETCL